MHTDSNRSTAGLQDQTATILDHLSDSKLLARLWLYRANGRPGYPLRAMWRAYAASFVLGMGSTNDLIRRLQVDASLRSECGFGAQLPHRTTFNRFVSRLSRHPDLVEEALARATEEAQGTPSRPRRRGSH